MTQGGIKRGQTWSRRAGSFGEDAERYDRARPSYPAALVDDLMADAPKSVLDIGCGTGKAAVLFKARGCEVLGVERDPRMGAVAEHHGIPIEVSSFEAWEPRDRTFNLVTCGQAWHWVDAEVGAPKVAAILKPGGLFAAFWNYGTHDAETQGALNVAYGEHAPQCIPNSIPLGTARGDRSRILPFDDSPRFGKVEERKYEWALRYSAQQWIDQLPTHSDHRLLPPGELEALLDAVARAIDGLGGTLTSHYETVAFIARRTRV